MKTIYLLMMAAAVSSAQVKVVTEADRVRVEIDGKPFTDFILRGGEAMKPYLHPLRSASGKIVTRHFPMEKVEGEPTDHPHQRGLWFAHDSVNGFDFWNNEANYTTPIRGRIVVDKITAAKSGKKAGSIAAMLSWIDPHDVKLLDQSLQMTFHSDPTLRIIDYDTTLTAVTKVTFGDSKDGTFGLRIAPVLEEPAPPPKGKIVNTHGSVSSLPHTGVITNAEGMEHEAAVWGKPSNWMDYSGEIDGEKLGIAIFDHPENSRRARWHVRAYGLFAANPFGLSTFTGDKSQNGSVTLEPGGKLRFRYRVVIHPGDAKSAGLAKLWEQYLK